MLALCMFVVAERNRADGLFDWAWAMAALGLAAASLGRALAKPRSG